MSTRSINEIDIWTSIISPNRDDLPPSDANAILRWEFNEQAKERIDELATRNGRGALTDAEREELESYVHVGQVVAILQAKARLSLKRAGGNGSH